jgi:histone H3/H4
MDLSIRPNASIDSVTETLEAVCARLRALKIELDLPGDVLGLVDAVLAKPGTHKALLCRLARSDRDLLIAIARGALDDLRPDEEDNGYPWMYLRPSDASNPNLADKVREFVDDAVAAAEEHPALWADGESTSSSEESESDSNSNNGSDNGDGSEDLCWGSGADSSWEAAEADEDEDDMDTMRARLEDLDESESEDPLDILLGDACRGKKPRLDVSEIPDEGVAAALRRVEEKIDYRDAGAEQRDRLFFRVASAADTFEALREIAGPSEKGLPAVIEEIAGFRDLARWEAREREHLSAPKLEALLGEARARIDGLAQRRPALKRKRDELEALGEIRAEQRGTDPIINPGAFEALVGEIAQDYTHYEDIRFTPGAIAALQAAAEGYLVDLLGATNRAAIHAGRTHILPSDMQFVRGIRGEHS